MFSVFCVPTVHAEEKTHAEIHKQVQRPGDGHRQPNCAGETRGVPSELDDAQRSAHNDESTSMILNVDMLSSISTMPFQTTASRTHDPILNGCQQVTRICF